MDNSKMSGSDLGYEDGVHDEIAGIAEPTDDSITISSFNNSQMTYSKSFNHSKRSTKGDRQSHIQHDRGNPDYGSPEDYNDQTLSVESINSSPGGHGYRREEHKGIHSPNFREVSNSPREHDNTLDLDLSKNPHEFQGKNFRQGGFDKSLEYEGDIFEDSISQNARGPIQFTQTTGRNQNTITSNYEMTDLHSDYDDEPEDEESEGEISESLRNIDESYESTEENNSLANHTPYGNRGDNNKSRITNSLHERTPHGQDQYTDSRYDDDYEGEDYYESEEEEASANFDSQISGYDSLSQTYKSKVSSNNFRRSSNHRRRMKKNEKYTENDTVTSRYNDTNESRQYGIGNESIPHRSRNDINNDSISGMQSNNSWGAETPKKAMVAPRTLKENEQNKFVPFQSPDGRSLIIDESVIQDRATYKNSQGTEHFRGSNLHNESDLFNSRTGKKSKRLTKGIGNIREDKELSNVLKDKEIHNSKNQIYLDKSYEKQMNNTSQQEPVSQNQKIHHKKLATENRLLKQRLAKVESALNKKGSLLESAENHISDLGKELNTEQSAKAKLEIEFHMLKDKAKGVSDIKIKGANSEKLKKSHDTIKKLKNQAQKYEREIRILTEEIDNKRDMEAFFNAEMEKLEVALDTYRIKEDRFAQQERQIEEYKNQIDYIMQEKEELILKAKSSMAHLEGRISSKDEEIRRRDQEIEKLLKQMKDNEHLLTEDQYNYKKHLDEIESLKSQLAEVTNELEDYKEVSKSNPMSHKIDIDRELQRQQHEFSSKLQSAHQQIDEWRNKCRDKDSRIKKFEKQINILEHNLSSKGNNSTAVDQSEVNEIYNTIRDIFNLNGHEDIFEELEKIKDELDLLEPLKEENEKANQLYHELQEKYAQAVSQQTSHGGNEYIDGLLKSKSEENDRLNNEVMLLMGKIEEAENKICESNHERHILISKVNELNRVKDDKERENSKLKNINSELKANLENDGARKILLEKKELEAKIAELSKEKEFENSKTSKDLGYLKKDFTALVSFILSLEFAYDEEFSNLLKNQSYSNEFDQAKKHLEFQKDIVTSTISRLTNECSSQKNQLSSQKEYIQELEEKIETSDSSKNEAVKWKQSYERLALTLKNTQGTDSKEMERLIEDHQNLQNTIEDLKQQKEEVLELLQGKENEITDLQRIITQNKKEISHLQQELESIQEELDTESKTLNTQNSTLLLKLEKDLKKLESENVSLRSDLETSRKSLQSLNEKYQLSVEKSLKNDQLEHFVERLENEKHSLQDQISILKKNNAEQMKLLKSNEPAEMMATIKNLKATMSKRDDIIQEQKAQLDVLQNLLDEAREEMGQDDQSEKSEKPTFADALEILDSIISKPLGISSTSKGQEFNQILKRAQLIKDQSEEPILRKIISFMSEYLPPAFKDQEKQCENINDLKQLFIDNLMTLRDQYRAVSESGNDLLDVSTDSKNMRRPYGFKDAHIDIIYILEKFNDTYNELTQSEHEKALDARVKELQSKYNSDLTSLGDEYIEKFQKERTDLISQLQAEKQSEIKIKEAAIVKDYDTKRQQMFEQFEALKMNFQEQFSQKSKEYQEVCEKENEKLRKDIEKQKESYEEEYITKLQKKTNQLEGMFNTRKNQLEDEFNLKQQKLEFELKSKAETEEGKNKAELDLLVQKFEKQSQEKIKRIEDECAVKIQEIQEKLDTKEAELKKAKSDYTKKTKEHKKIMERELKFKSETQERECKSKFDRDLKKHHEQIEELEQTIRDMQEKMAQEKKAHKDALKTLREKHKSEVKNIKNNHENELIRKRIEAEKEFKDMKRDLENQLQETRKESLEKESEMNQKFNDKEISLLKKHVEEIQGLRSSLTEKNEKVLNQKLEEIKREFEEKYKTDMDHEVQCATERVKNQYQTENETLRIKLQEINETQSLATIENQQDAFAQKEEESVQTDNFLYPIHASEMKRMKKPMIPFDYQQRNDTEHKKESDDEEGPRKPPTARSMMTAQNDKEIIGIIHQKNQQDMNILQHKYEARITKLLEDHMDEINETKAVAVGATVKKIERILILELEKMCQAIL